MEDFKKIYAQYVKDVYRFALKLSGNPDVADEITQITFLKAFEKINEFRGDCKLSVWLCQIAKYEYFAYCKKKKSSTSSESLQELADSECFEEKLLDKEESFHILEILHYIPEPYKEVFTLRVMGEYSYRDIGRLFRKTESWARVTYYRAKSMIIERMEREENE